MKRLYIRTRNLLKKKKQPLITTALLACVVVSYQNCQQKEEYFARASLSAITEPPIERMTQPPAVDKVDETLCKGGSSEDLICNPLGGGEPDPREIPSVPASKLGLIANLFEGQHNWNHIDRYFSEGYRHPENIYFSNFNIPTRSFSDGFGFGPNDFLKNQAGEKLIEWFAIQAKGHIVLPESEAGGYYHIASQSDDGIRIIVDGEVILSNPNVHGPTVDCAKSLIFLNKGEEKTFELNYFQGPRYHIALSTYIKKIEDPSSFARGQHCNGMKSPEALVENGYKIIGSSWFTLPAGF